MSSYLFEMYIMILDTMNRKGYKRDAGYDTDDTKNLLNSLLLLGRSWPVVVIIILWRRLRFGLGLGLRL
jgi:hypothetical protein